MLISVIKMPRFELFWNNETWYEPIASTLPLKRYKILREFLHVVDNAEKDKPDSKGDKCFKVKPLLEAVRTNCNKIEPEVNHSIDEQIIPAKTKKSGGVRQCNPKKPHKWRFKNRNQGFRLFFDNWFPTLDLIVQLKSIRILSTATFCTNRLKVCPIASNKELKKKERSRI